MNKQEFLYMLQQCLSDLPQEDVSQSLEYYAEMIDDCTEDGMTQEEAVAQLGTPSDVAERIRLEMPLPTLVRARAANARRPKAWEIVLIVLGSPVWLPLALSVLAVLVSLYAVIWSILIAMYAVALALAVVFLGLIGLSVWTIRGQDILHGVFLLGAGLVCGGLAILLFLMSKALTVVVCRATAAFVRKCKKSIAGKGSAA